MCVWRWYLVFHTHTCVCVYVRPFLFPWCVDSCFPSAKSRHLFPGLAPSGACSSSKVWKPKSHQLRRNSSRFHATTCAVRFNRLSIAGWRHFRNQNSRDVGMLGIPSGDFNIATMVRFWMIYPLQMTFHSYVSYVTLLKDTEGYLTYGPYGPYGFSFLQISPQNMASLARHGTIPLWYLNGSLHAVIDWTSGHCSSKYLNWTSYLRHISAGESDRHHLVKFFLLPHDFSFLFHPIPQNEISTCGLVLGLFTLDSGTGGDWIIRGMAFYNTCLILFPPVVVDVAIYWYLLWNCPQWWDLHSQQLLDSPTITMGSPTPRRRLRGIEASPMRTHSNLRLIHGIHRRGPPSPSENPQFCEAPPVLFVGLKTPEYQKKSPIPCKKP